MVLEDFLYPAEAFGGGEAANGGFVDAGFGSEAIGLGGLLEFLDEFLEVALFVEVVGERSDGVGIELGRCGGGERSGEGPVD